MPRVSKDDLSDELELSNVEVSDEITDKLLLLCATHGLSAEDLVNELVAYSLSNCIEKFTLDVLEPFDKKWLMKKRQSTTTSKEQPMILDIKTIQDVMDDEDDDDAVNLMGNYASTPVTPVSKPPAGQKRQITPENESTIKRFTGVGRTPTSTVSTPKSATPRGATPSRKYGSRTNAGEVACTFGSTTGVSWAGKGGHCQIEHAFPEMALTQEFKFMFQKQADKATVLNDQIEEMASLLQEKHSIEEFSPVFSMSQEPIDVVGRIFCDSNGKLNAKSVMLQGCRNISAGRVTPVDLSELPSYSLFPGQIVAFNGFNPTGNVFVAKKLYESVELPSAQYKKTEDSGSYLSVVMAAGPFTTSDSLANEPLQDLLVQIQKQTPDVCILFGPFVDTKNEEIEKGTVDMTYEELFKTQLLALIDTAARCGCHIVLIPSIRDAHHNFIYPLAPFSLDKVFRNVNAEQKEKLLKHLDLMSDPCILSIKGVVFALTSTDVVMHLSGEEISFPPGSPDRMGRLVTHLLQQHSFYPLHPPTEDMCVEYEQLDVHCRIPAKPHVLVTPSDLRYFIKDVGGCCCVNPGRLAKGQVGGTFCRLSIKLPDPASSAPLVANVVGQVVRV